MEYYSLNQYLKDTFGCKVYKLALNGGFTCPNRDGTLDTRGCIFCSGQGSGDFAESCALTITEQIEAGKARVSKKINDGKYIAYFQAFTNTYGSVEKQRRLFMEAISHPDIVALSVATRPDCLPEDVIDLLKELNQIKPVWVELGLQTIHESSVAYIRRCYPNSTYLDAVSKLKNIGINVITHVILGLPGESKQDMLDTVRFVVDAGGDGIKLQLLHVIKGTDLCNDYMSGCFDCLNMDEYVDILIDCLRIIPKSMVVHRLTGDGDQKTLVAPLWSGDKKRVINTINRAVAEA